MDIKYNMKEQKEQYVYFSNFFHYFDFAVLQLKYFPSNKAEQLLTLKGNS